MTEDQTKRQQEQIQLLRQLRLAVQQEDFVSAMECFQRLAQLAHENGDLGAEGRHLGNLALLYYRLNQPDVALHYFANALELARQDEDQLTQSGLLGNIGNIQRELRRFDTAIANLSEALRIANEREDVRGRGIWLGNLALVFDDLRQVEEALTCHQESVQIARDLRDKRGLASRLANMGNTYVSKGDPVTAIPCFEEAVTLYEELGETRALAASLGMLANLHSVLGQVTTDPTERNNHQIAVLGLCIRALMLAQQNRDSVSEARLRVDIGDAQLALGQYDRAIEHYDVAAQLFTQLGQPALNEEMRKRLALALYRRNQAVDAARIKDNRADSVETS